MIKAAIFDLDNTLYDYDAAHGAAWRALTAFAGEALGLAPADFDALHEAAFALQKRRCGRGAAVHNRLLRYQLMLEALGRPVALAPAMANLYWTTLLSAVRPLPGMLAAVDALRDMGLVIGVGTNMTADRQYDKLERLDLMDRLDFIVTSEEAGVEKPDPGLFALCAQKAGCPPAACAFIGDSLKSDALGARDAGLRAVWLRRSAAPADAPDGVTVVRSLGELPEIVRGLF